MSFRRFLDPSFVLFLSISIALAAAAPIVAQGPASARVAEVATAGSSVDFRPLVDGDRYVLTVSTPGGTVVRREFAGGKTPTFAVGQRPDGVYNWELTVSPHVDKALRRDIENARKSDDAARARELMATAGFPKATLVQSGSFTVAGGQVLSSDTPERRPRAAEKLVTIAAEDQVIPDDLIVQGSECVGFDCVNNEPFGFDTIRLKENNLRILFMDTSVGAFPSNDWQLVANDSASGGQNKFSIEDVTGARVPVTIEAGAATNSVYVDSTNNVGFGTSTPVLDLHISTSDTPAIRLEQNNSGGFTAQTWDIAGNEANFFVRDVTGGSLLPFRVRPGAPTSSIDISADGDVGIGTASPREKLDVGTGLIAFGDPLAGSESTFGQRSGVPEDLQARARRNVIFTVDHDASSTNASFSVSRDDNPALVTFVTREDGLNGFNIASPTFPLTVGTDATNGNGAHVTAAGVWTNGSSRRNKENIRSLETEEALTALSALEPVHYTGVNSPDGEEYVGFIAEDVPGLVAMNDRASLSAMDIVAVLTKVTQQQQQTIEALAARVAELEGERRGEATRP